MSRSQFQSKRFILRHAWLNLWDERMTTGRINQISLLTTLYPVTLSEILVYTTIITTRYTTCYSVYKTSNDHKGRSTSNTQKTTWLYKAAYSKQLLVSIRTVVSTYHIQRNPNRCVQKPLWTSPQSRCTTKQTIQPYRWSFTCRTTPPKLLGFQP